MGKVKDTAGGCGFFVLLFAAYLGWCYLEVAEQHRYAPEVAEAMAQVPGARLVSSFKSGDLVNPVSWFWAPVTRLVYARPDPSVPTLRFFVLSFGIADPYDRQPVIMLHDVDCSARNYVIYFPEQPGDTGEPALTALGGALTAPNGSRFLRHDTRAEPSPELLEAFCDADWSRERRLTSNT